MIQNILKYQTIERDLRKIEQEIQASGERKKAQSAKNFLLDSDENLSKMDKRAEELLQLLNKAKKTYQENADILKEYEATANTLKSGDEASYLAKKIGQIIDILKNTEREIALITKDIEDVGKSFTEFKAKYSVAKKEYTENKEKFDIIKQSKVPQINEIKKKLDALAVKIDTEILEKYKKKRDDKIFPVLVPVRDNMCGGCSMEISLKEMDKLKSKKVIECENCQRMIYTD